MLGQWLNRTVASMNLETESIAASYTEIEQMVQNAGPTLLRLAGENQSYFLVLLKAGWQRVTIIAPDLSTVRVRAKVIRDILTHEIEAPLAQSIEQLLIEAGVPEQRRAHAKAAILREQLSGIKVSDCWLLRLSPAADFWHQMRHARLPRYLLRLAGVQIIMQGLQLVGWWIIIQSALQGHFDQVELLAWGLVLLIMVPFQVLTIWTQSLFTVGTGQLFKQQLLYGTLQLKPEEIRHQGLGQFLGRVMESEAVEVLVLGGGLTALMALIELITALIILTMGTGGGLHAFLLLLWIILIVLIGWRYFKSNKDWIENYREMTNDLVERMIGHRTRLIQEDPQHWHDEEDQILATYSKFSERLDSVWQQLSALTHRGWLILGLMGLAHTFIMTPLSAPQMAVSLGGIILASKALNSLVIGLQTLIGVVNAWKQVAPLLQAANRGKNRHMPASIMLPENNKKTFFPDKQPVLVARDLWFRYRDSGQPILRECSLQINRGDHLLLEGPSGSGKSTLAAILAGLRTPESGLLLLHGLEQPVLDTEEWRGRVVSAPQFHDNHIFTETFAFNLLMGRRWPPLPEDLKTADQVCRELGLGELIDQMPAGFQQMVGESGWQLSHGERSRLYIARALLQSADLIIFDESFAALDPENLQRALRCVLNRAPTLLVIAHP